jgi:hypothetical protein
VPGERVGARLEGWQAEGGARARAPCCTAPNNALEPTPTASARTSLRLLARLTAGVLPDATRRENKELKTDAPSGHGLAAAFGLRRPG